jgi:hypothetical protein
LPQWSVYEWIEKLKNDCTSITHKEGTELLTTATTDNSERICDMVLLERRLNIDDVANHLQISHGSEYYIIFYFY